MDDRKGSIRFRWYLLALVLANIALWTPAGRVAAQAMQQVVLHVGTAYAPVQLSHDDGVIRTINDHPDRVECRLTTTATTSTAITGCAAPGAGLSIYVTDISVYGGVATGATAAATVLSGTGGLCGTGPVISYYCQHPATAGCEAHMTTPIKAVANGELCLIDATVGTKFVTVRGFIAP